MLVQQLATACPKNDTLGCRLVEVSILIKPRFCAFTLIFPNVAHQAYIYIQLGINALNGAHHDEAVDHFTAAVHSSAFSSTSDIHSIYEDLVVVH
jgi:hypothetical protein